MAGASKARSFGAGTAAAKCGAMSAGYPHPSRSLAWLLALAWTGCVTVQGDLIRSTEPPPGVQAQSECGPNSFVASLEPASRSRIALAFKGTQRCTSFDLWERHSEVVTPLRLTVSVVVGLAIFVPAIVAFAVANSPAKPSGPGSNGGEQVTGLIVGWSSLAVGAIAGGATYYGLGRLPASPRPEDYVPRPRVVDAPAPVKSGLLTGAGLPAAGRTLVGGVVELSIEEAQSFAVGDRFLDGLPVTLTPAASVRLSALPACSSGLRAFADYKSGAHVDLPSMWSMVKECDAAEWGFVDEAYERLRGILPFQTPGR